MPKYTVVCVSPYEDLIAVGCDHGQVGFCDMQGKFTPMEGVRQHNGPVSHLAFSTDHITLVSGSVDGTICVWNISSRAAITMYLPKSFPAPTIARLMCDVEFVYYTVNDTRTEYQIRLDYLNAIRANRDTSKLLSTINRVDRKRGEIRENSLRPNTLAAMERGASHRCTMMTSSWAVIVYGKTIDVYKHTAAETSPMAPVAAQAIATPIGAVIVDPAPKRRRVVVDDE